LSFFFDCEDESTFNALFDRLSDDGSVRMPPDEYPFAQRFAWLIDRYGVSWQLSLAAELRHTVVRRLAVAALIPLAGVIALGCGSSVSTTPPKATSPPTTAPTTTTSLPTPTTAASSSTAVAAGSPCTSGQLSVTTGSFQGAAGTEFLPLIFTNTSSELCTLQGFPGVSAVIANGVQLGQPAARDTGPSTPLVALEPGQTTSATFTYLNPSIACTSPTLALGLRVYPPNQTAALFVATTGVGQCPGSDANFRIYPVGASSD
jgi:hypothetical protein